MTAVADGDADAVRQAAQTVKPLRLGVASQRPVHGEEIEYSDAEGDGTRETGEDKIGGVRTGREQPERVLLGVALGVLPPLLHPPAERRQIAVRVERLDALVHGRQPQRFPPAA